MADIQEEAAMDNEESQNTAAEDGEIGEKPATENEPVEQTEENSGDQETKEAAGESGEAGEDHAADGEGAPMGEKPSNEEGGEGQTQDAESKEDQEVAVEEQQSGEGVQAENEDGEVEQTVAEPSDVVEGEAVENVDVVDPSATDAVPDSGTGEEAEGAGEAAPAESGELAEPNEAEEQGEETAAGAPSADVEEGEGEAKEAEGEGEEQAAGEGGEEQAEESKEGEEGEGEESGPAQEVGSETAVIDDENKAPSPVGQELSRGPTPDDAAAVQLEYQRLEATTPDRIDETDELGYVDGPGDDEREAVMVEEEEEPEFRRDELIEKYHEALADREQLQQQNYSLQHKLAEYFRKKKADERQDYDKNVTDQEQRYLKYMAQLEDLRRQDMTEKENYQIQIEDAKDRCQERKEKVDLERKKFMDFKKQVALNAINSRSGKPIPPKDIEQYMVNEMKKEQEVVNVRLENIKLKNKLKKKEQQLKSKEELAEGLHLIDFEQLKIENQTYNEKIEERNEELLKLRKKITSTVQVLTHLKEKLQFVQGENLDQSNTLKEVESSLAQSRDILSRTKQARDALRIDNQKLRQNCGLLGNEPLLRDFEERKDESDDLRGKLEELRMRHAELTLHCNQVRRKIDQVRQGMH